jgi:hypothetical protein
MRKNRDLRGNLNTVFSAVRNCPAGLEGGL